MTGATSHDETGPAPSHTSGSNPAPGHEPGTLERIHALVLDRWPMRTRSRIATIAVLVAVLLVAISTLARLIGAALDAGLLAYLGLMVVCWVGAGGALVPVPGVRPLSWIMIVHQSTVLAAPVVVLVAALAMALGQSSYFLAARAESHRHGGRGGQHRLGRHRPHGDAGAATGDAGTAPARRSSAVMTRSRALLASGEAAVKRRMDAHPHRILFLLCMLPNPLTTFATVTAATTGLPFVSFFIASLGGFLVLAAALAVAGEAILVALGLA